MSNGKLSRSISNHPFIFLTSLALVTIVSLAGYLFFSGKGKSVLFPPIPTATATATPVPTVTPTGTPVPPTPTITPEPTKPAQPLVVTFIDMGQGESILIEAPNGQIALIDGGSAGSGVLAYLQEQGIKSIDIMIASHSGIDHFGGLVEVLDTLPVKKVIVNAQSDNTTAYQHFLDAIATAKAEYEEVERGDTINLESLTFSVLSPAKIDNFYLKPNSLVLRMSSGNTTFLFMGDADKNVEASILEANLPVKADILKVGDHGSCAASSPAFLDAVQPRVAIYFAGINNPFGYPCTATIRALDQRGIDIFGTDVDGTMKVTVTEDGFTITNSTGLLFRK